MLRPCKLIDICFKFSLTGFKEQTAHDEISVSKPHSLQITKAYSPPSRSTCNLHCSKTTLSNQSTLASFGSSVNSHTWQRILMQGRSPLFGAWLDVHKAYKVLAAVFAYPDWSRCRPATKVIIVCCNSLIRSFDGNQDGQNFGHEGSTP